MKISLGRDLEVDLDSLLRNRMLIQANSGGGKSYVLRKLLEETHGKVQHIVLDLEGEFSTLREKYDYLLVGKDGDISTEVRSAKLLARKVLEYNISTIIDLYELKHYERITFVKNFLEALVNARKELWHPCLVVVDEAHIFCPEKSKSESMSSVIDLATRGRKRGFCAVLATQRLSKLHKDAAAECNNKLIGRTGLDVDMKRAAEELGFTSKQQMLSLRELEPGDFYGFGPAISKSVIKTHVGEVKTTHPEAGVLPKPTAPTRGVKQLIAKLSDLPQQAETELREKSDFLQEIRRLKADAKRTHKAVDPQDIERVHTKGFDEGFRKAWKEYSRLLDKIQKEKSGQYKVFARNKNTVGKAITLLQSIESAEEVKTDYLFEKPTNPSVPTPQFQPTSSPTTGDEVEGEVKFGLCAKKLYTVIQANRDREFTKVQLGLLAGYSHKSGGFNNALSQLKSNNLIKNINGKFSLERVDTSLTIEGEEELSLDYWKKKLSRCPSAIFIFLLNNPTFPYTKEDIAANTFTDKGKPYEPNSGGFNNSLSKLCSLGLVVRTSPGTFKFNTDLEEFI